MTLPENILLLHTCDATGVVGLHTATGLSTRILSPERRHAQTVLGSIAELLEEAATPLSAIQGLALTVGPGSFTGIRIGLATAQGLAAARRWTVWTTHSLAVLAQVVGLNRGWIAVVKDAKRHEVYAALYHANAEVVVEVVPPFCASPSRTAERICEAMGTSTPRGQGDDGITQSSSSGEKILLMGDGCQAVREQLPSDSELMSVHDEASPEVWAHALWTLVASGKCLRQRPEELEPLYLRKSDAEILRQQRAAS